jgi:hypothetical protein
VSPPLGRIVADNTATAFVGGITEEMGVRSSIGTCSSIARFRSYLTGRLWPIVPPDAFGLLNCQSEASFLEHKVSQPLTRGGHLNLYLSLGSIIPNRGP